MKKLLVLLILLSAKSMILSAQNGNHQPYVNYWFPSTLLNWSPATDTSAPFNRSRVPLASRFIDTFSSPCPVSKNPNVKLTCLTITNGSTSANPSQGYDHAGEYAFGFWQYINYFVMWGGSAGEGLILAPNATWIDAGHRNGVKVMGTIFLPPTAYGGQLQWVNDLLQSSGGVFPVADKLIEAANYYGFDGWFINQETAGGSSATATAMEGFMAYFQQHKTANMEIMWYDAMTTSGSVGWQGALNSNNLALFQNGSTLESNSMFLDFRWTSSTLTSSASNATTAGRSPFDLYAGIDVQANGYNTSVSWTRMFPAISTPKTSVGLYVPSWTFHSSPDKNNIPLFYQREEQFWVGANHSPCNVPSTGWPGLSKYYIEKSVINSWPFITDFNTGHGTNGFWLNGNRVSARQWHNQSIQDILPTWRWVSQSSGTPLTVDWDFTDAYNGGNSLKVSGTLSSGNTTTVKLYNTQLAVSSSSSLQITYKLGAAGASNMQVAAAFTDAPTTFYYLNCGSSSGAGWQSTSFSLGSYAGKTLCVVGLQFASSSTINNYQMNVGEIALTDGNATQPSPVSNLRLSTYTDCDNAELQVLYDTSTSNDIWYYDIYRFKPNGSIQWLGRTPNTAYYVKTISRIDNEANTQIEVIAVNKSGLSSAPLTQSFSWPANPTNSAASFNGSNKYFSNGINNLSGSAITLEGWVYPNSLKSSAPSISAIAGIDDTMQNTALLRIGNATVGNNHVQFALNVGGSIRTLTSATALSTGSWYHIAGTYDGSHMTLYINGIQDTLMAATGSVKANGHFYIGRDSVASATSYLDGSMDELRAWTIARSAGDIAANMCSVSDTTTGLAAYWTFNDCSNGAIAYDNSGYGHNGSSHNMTTTDWIASTISCSPNGIENISADDNKIRLYPNPQTSGKSLTLDLSFSGASDYYIYDETGKLIVRQSTSQRITTIDTEKLSAGIYLCRVINNGNSYTSRFVIEK